MRGSSYWRHDAIFVSSWTMRAHPSMIVSETGVLITTTDLHPSDCANAHQNSSPIPTGWWCLRITNTRNSLGVFCFGFQIQAYRRILNGEGSTMTVVPNSSGTGVCWWSTCHAARIIKSPHWCILTCQSYFNTGPCSRDDKLPSTYRQAQAVLYLSSSASGSLRVIIWS